MIYKTIIIYWVYWGTTEKEKAYVNFGLLPPD